MGSVGSVGSEQSIPTAPTSPTSLSSLIKQIVGMPDYARYMEHARTHHPECPVLTEREFYDRYLSTRYGNGATRCC